MPRASSNTDPGGSGARWPMRMQGDGGCGSRGLAGAFNCLKQELIAPALPYLHVV